MSKLKRASIAAAAVGAQAEGMLMRAVVASLALVLTGSVCAANWRIQDLGEGFVPSSIGPNGQVLPIEVAHGGITATLTSLNEGGYGLAYSGGQWTPANAYLYSSGTLTPITGMLQIYSVNPAGYVVGAACDGPKCGAAAWKDGVVAPLASWEEIPYEGYGRVTHARAMNTSGQAAGSMLTFPRPSPDPAYVPVFITGGMATVIQGFHPAHCISCGEGIDINEAGVMIGFHSSVGLSGGFVAGHSGGSEIGVPSGYYSRPVDINNNGAIVGVSGPLDEAGRATLWHGGFIDLTLLPEVQSADWRLLYHVSAINDLGQIVGVGRRNDGSYHGYLLSPIAEPSTYALMSLGLVGIGLLSRRRRNEPRPAATPRRAGTG